MKTAYRFEIILMLILVALSLIGCSPRVERAAAGGSDENLTAPPESTVVEFTLQTLVNDGGLAYIGIGGEIDGVINPDLLVKPGDTVRIILQNGDGMPHDLFLPDFDAKTSYVSKIGDQTEIVFEVGEAQPGIYVYYCTLPGHRQAGQEGKLIVAEP